MLAGVDEEPGDLELVDRDDVEDSVPLVVHRAEVERHVETDPGGSTCLAPAKPVLSGVEVVVCLGVGLPDDSNCLQIVGGLRSGNDAG